MPSSSDWKRYFEANAKALCPIPWHLGAELSPRESLVIRRSLCEFQAGEGSEGSHLIHYAREYATRSGDSDYLDAIRLFIAEEQRHSRDLGRFLVLNGIPLVKTTFTDRVFRRLRHCFGGLEISVGVLVTAEIIARVYYLVLKKCCASTVLRHLCDQILHDEVRHVQFQCEQLSTLRHGRGAVGRAITMGIQRTLYAGTVFVVWIFHRKVIRAANFSFLDWWTACWAVFREAFFPRPNQALEPTIPGVTPRAEEKATGRAA